MSSGKSKAIGFCAGASLLALGYYLNNHLHSTSLPKGDDKKKTKNQNAKYENTSLKEIYDNVFPEGLDFSSVGTLRAVSEAMAQQLENEPSIPVEELKSLLTHYGTIERAVRMKFPGALASSEVLSIVVQALESRGYNDDNVHFATSVCPDEINHGECDLPVILAKHWGECFHLGGLAGVPFPGKTGFTAFSHHAPDNGHLFVFYGPHVGVHLPRGCGVEDVQIGKFAREGQEGEDVGSSCGSAVGAFNFLSNGGKVPNFEDLGSNHLDYQQQWVTHQIGKFHKELSENEDPMNELPFKMYEVIEKFIKEICVTSWRIHDKDEEGGDIIFLGGIHINTPEPLEDYFLPLNFEVCNYNADPVNLNAIFQDK